MSNSPLNEKVALVTGAGRGIGKGIALSLAGAGADVAVVDIEESTGPVVSEQIRNQGQRSCFIQADLQREDSIREMIETCVERLGRLDILVNNAKPRLEPLPFEQSLDAWDLEMNVMLKAPTLTTRYARPHLSEHRDGSIINIASTNARYVSHQPVTYHVAKAGLVQLTRYLAREFGQDGIRVNSISPGLVDILDDGQPLTSRHPNDVITETAVPLQRACTVEEIGNLVVFLSSEGGSYVTGQDLTIDGGITVNDHFHVARKAFERQHRQE